MDWCRAQRLIATTRSVPPDDKERPVKKSSFFFFLFLFFFFHQACPELVDRTITTITNQIFRIVSQILWFSQ